MKIINGKWNQEYEIEHTWATEAMNIHKYNSKKCIGREKERVRATERERERERERKKERERERERERESERERERMAVEVHCFVIA